MYETVNTVNMSARQRAIDAALSVFSHYGFRHASIEMVAERLGVTRQALYRHFPSKEAMLTAVAEDLHGEALRAAEYAAACAQSNGQPLDAIVTDALYARFQHILAHLATSPHASELLEEHAKQCGPVVTDFAQRFLGTIERLIDAEIASGRYVLRKGMSSRALARFLFLTARALKTETSQIELRVDKTELALLVNIIVAGSGSADDASHKTPQLD